MKGWKQDFLYAVRMFSRAPGWSLIVVLSLALGIGANTAIFSVVNAVLLSALPYHAPEKLVMVWEDASFVGFPENTPAPANYFDWKSQNQVFVDMAAVASQSFNLTGSGEPLRLPAYAVTQNFFPLLGVRPLHGRFFSPEEDVAGANQVVMLSYGLWQTRFGGSPNTVGQTIQLNNKAYTVIGVMPQQFQFIDPEIQVWVPIGFTPEDRSNRGSHYLQVVARLKEGVSFQQAEAQMKNVMDRIAREYPDEAGPLGILLVPLREQLVGDVRRQLILLLIAVGFVLLIACANISNLLLSLAVSRKREIAVRTALGAGKWRITRQLLVENLFLAALGGLLGLGFAIVSFRLLNRLIPAGLAGSTALGINISILGFTAIVSVITALLFGLAPAVQVARTSISDALKAGGTRSRDTGGKRIRAFMVVAETALALVLLVGAGLLIQTIYNLQHMDAGFRSENVLRMETRLPRTPYDTKEKRVQFYEQVLERVEALPGVQSAGYSTAVPLDWKGGTSGYQWEGQPWGKGEVLDANHREVSGRLLETLGIRIVEGKYFDGSETSSSLPVAIVNEAMARTYRLGGSPVGKRFQVYGEPIWFTVIGVARNIRNMGLEVEPKAEMYLPVQQSNFGFSFYAPKELLIRTKNDPKDVVRDAREIIRAVDPNLPVSNVMTVSDVRAREISHRRMTMVILAAFAALALLLAAIGTYGVLSYFVTQQVPEIGVRLALGAQPIAMLGLVFRRGMILVATGVVLGIIAAVALSGILQSLLYGIQGRDFKTMLLTALLLLLCAAAACIIPGRRAMKIDPIVALRYE